MHTACAACMNACTVACDRTCMRTTNPKKKRRFFAQVLMVGSKCRYFKNREVSNVNAPMYALSIVCRFQFTSTVCQMLHWDQVGVVLIASRDTHARTHARTHTHNAHTHTHTQYSENTCNLAEKSSKEIILLINSYPFVKSHLLNLQFRVNKLSKSLQNYVRLYTNSAVQF